MFSQKRRVHDFQGTDHEYITYLESLVLRGAAHCPPSPPHSEVRDEVIDDDSNGDYTTSLAFIPYKPETKGQDCCSGRPGKRKRTAPRWERLMDEIIDEMTAEDWATRRTNVGLSSPAEILAALDILIDGTKRQSGPTGIMPDLSTACDRPSNTILQLLNSFATHTAALEIHKKFTIQLLSFRSFIFVSLCCVALRNGADKEVVDIIMQKCISDSCKKNLARLRKGALWVNQAMFKLASDGFGHLAYELFVLCKVGGRSIAKYGRFADAGEPGFRYFKSHVPKYKPGVEVQASLPFWVPFIIKTIVGDFYSLSAICTALSYGIDPQIHDYPRYLENYRNRRMPLPCSLNAKVIAATTQKFQAGASNGRDKEADVSASGSTATGIQALLEAAQQSDSLPKSAAGQQAPMAAGALTALDGVAVYAGRPLEWLDLNTENDPWGDMNFFNEGWVDIFSDYLPSQTSCLGI